MEAIRPLADRWLQLDRDTETRAEIEDLIAKQEAVELERRLRKRIAFGTAGLRSSMKAGFAHMNSLNVLTTSIGLANYIRQTSSTTSAQSVVIGYDGRYRSKKFASLAAAAFLQNGLKVLWFDRLVHTPLVPFTVSCYGAAAGVMVTASHNPKNDNGYKVYWANGSQIIPPHDIGIAKAIAAVQEIPESLWDESLVESHSEVESIYNDASNAYFEQIRALAGPISESRYVPSWDKAPSVRADVLLDKICHLRILRCTALVCHSCKKRKPRCQDPTHAYKLSLLTS
jgi:phosphoglucomutase